jgi:predicted esterase
MARPSFVWCNLPRSILIVTALDLRVQLCHAMRQTLPIVLLFASSLSAMAAEPGPTTAPSARQHVTFVEQSPLGKLEEYCRRTRQSPAVYKREGPGHEYTVADESFEVVVPEGCSATSPYGLFVWISPGRSGSPQEWLTVLERHKLIWISPNNAGNNRHFLVRIGLALDAVQNAKAKYAVDPKRIYVSGFSGGGRVSSMVGLTYPDVFTGAMPMMGCNFYRPLPAGGNKVFPASAGKPIDALFAQAKRLPFVLVTGERDPNQPQTKANHGAFLRDRFTHVTYIEVPGIGHDMPDAQWLEQGLADLDAAVAAAPATRPTTRRAGPRATAQ